MRDPNRIDEMLAQLEKVWKENPDFRLGQLLTIAAKVSTPHPRTFYIEDDKMLEGIKTFNHPRKKEVKYIPLWERCPEIIRINVEEITVELIREFLTELAKEPKNITITPIKLMELVGAPVDDETWMKGHQDRLATFASILTELEQKREIEVVQLGYEIVNEENTN